MDSLQNYHIAHLISSKDLYGAERWVLALIRAATKYGIKFSLINFTNNRNTKSDIVEIAEKENILALDFYTGGRYNPISGIRLAQWARIHRVDIFHSHGYKSDTLGLIAARINKNKIITTPHGWSLEKDIKENLYEKFDRFLFNFMDYVCPLSKDLYSNLSINYFLRNKLKLIINGVDIEEIDNQNSGFDKTQCKEFVIGYIGQLIKRKNIPILLDALKILISKKSNIKMILIGDGQQRLLLENKVISLGLDPYVIFYGNRKDVLNILKSLDLLILPSLMEGIPRCVMEAMAAKIPVIASDIPGNRDLIIDGDTGLLFNPYNKEELVRKINYVMDNPEIVKNMVVKARVKLEREYSNQRMAYDYIKLYSSLLNAS